MAVSTRTRFEVFKRDKFTCQYCGRNPPTVVLHCDHIVPQSEGGGDEMLNLVTSCVDCNLGKSNVPLGQVTRPIAEQMAEAAERRSQVEAYNQFLLAARESEEKHVEELGRTGSTCSLIRLNSTAGCSDPIGLRRREPF